MLSVSPTYTESNDYYCFPFTRSAVLDIRIRINPEVPNIWENPIQLSGLGRLIVTTNRLKTGCQECRS